MAERGPQVAYDVWLSDKKEPKEKTFQSGTTAMEFYASRSTQEYANWRALPKEGKGEAPANKYVYITLTAFDKKLQEHLYKIYYKVSEARAKNPGEKRPKNEDASRGSSRLDLCDGEDLNVQVFGSARRWLRVV